MKILYLRLLNSAGVYAGMNRKEIEIDFTKGNNSIVMLFGENGSGKSTVLSSLNPFNSTCNDDRDRFFIEGKEGQKEIHYKLNDEVFMIRHYISAKNKVKSFIARMPYDQYLNSKLAKNKLADKYGDELNENGGVKTFNETIKTILGVDEEFFKISRIGSNVTNFIDLSTANRKKYISTFLPNIDEYLQRYKIVNEKYRLMTKEIKYLSDEILKLEDFDSLKNNKERLDKKLKELNDKLNKTITNIATFKTNVANLDADGTLKLNGYKNPYEKEMKKINNLLMNLKLASIDRYNINEVKSELETINTNLAQFNNELKVIKDKIDREKSELVELKSQERDKQKQLEGMCDDDVWSLEQLELDYIRENARLIGDLNSVDRSHFINPLFNDFTKEQSYIMKDLYSTINSIKSKCGIDDKMVLKKIFTKKKISYKDFIKSLDDLKLTIKNSREELVDLNKKLATANSNRKYLDILNKRPSTCSDDSCPFVATAVKYQNIEETINDLENKINNLESNIETNKENLERFEYVKEIINNFENYFNQNKDKILVLNEVIKDFSINKFEDLMEYFLEKSDSELKAELSTNAEIIDEILAINEESRSVRDKLKEIKQSLENNKNMQKIYEQLKKEQDNLTTRINKIVKTINELKENYSKIDREIINNTALKENYDEILSNLEKAEEIQNSKNEISEKYNVANETIKKIEELAEKISENKELESSLKNIEIPEVERELDNIKIKINKLKEYTERKNKLESEYEKTSWIKESLNPTKGIPVYFIENYLNKTKIITNNLLDISQHGKFAIDFDVTDKDFFIKVFKNNGDTLSDISQASQGETALTSLSLSLALIEQSTNQYNIFLLDELDGALDTNNRRSFIDMVQEQMKVLNCEQVFIISHNNEFETIPVDMILLKDNGINTNDKTMMANKTVLFNL